MGQGAFLFHYPRERGEHDGDVWAWVIAVMFATVAALSFAIDQSLTFSPSPL